MGEKIDTLLKESRTYHPTAKTKSDAYIKDYETDYKRSIADPEGFWSTMAKELDWYSPWNKVLEWNYPWAKWFVGATCNISHNCLDRHVAAGHGTAAGDGRLPHCQRDHVGRPVSSSRAT